MYFLGSMSTYLPNCALRRPRLLRFLAISFFRKVWEINRDLYSRDFFCRVVNCNVIETFLYARFFEPSALKTLKWYEYKWMHFFRFFNFKTACSFYHNINYSPRRKRIGNSKSNVCFSKNIIVTYHIIITCILPNPLIFIITLLILPQYGIPLAIQTKSWYIYVDFLVDINDGHHFCPFLYLLALEF